MSSSRGGQRARDGLRSWFRGQVLDRAKAGPERGRLTGQVPVQGFIARVSGVEGREPVVVMPADWVGDVRGLRAREQDGDEPDAAGLIILDPIIDLVVDQ